MRPAEFFEQLLWQNDLRSNAELATLIGLTPGRISQMRTANRNLTARQLVSYIKKAEDRGRRSAYADPIRPIVEMYPINAVLSKQAKKWELLATGNKHPRNKELRTLLEAAQGL